MRCDSGRANVGEPCTGEGAACDMEGRAMLACQNDTFTQTRRCPGGCVVDGTTVRCR